MQLSTTQNGNWNTVESKLDESESIVKESEGSARDLDDDDESRS